MIYKSFLKWAGGKKSSINLIRKSIITEHNCLVEPFEGRLIEPFVGSGVVFLNLSFENYLLGDFNKDLINLFVILKKHRDFFIECCSDYFKPKFNTEEKFYELRKQFNNTNDVFERSMLFVYLNRHAFNGLCRYNFSGEFNVPYGKYENPYFPAKEMKFFYNKACFCDFVYQDFEVTIGMAKKEDVIYADAPYTPLSNTASFTHYSSNGFGLKQHERLVELAENSKCLFLISNHWTDVTKELYKNADSLIEININRSISSCAESRGQVKEILTIYRPS